MTCEECGSTTDVCTYNDPETGDPVPFCEPCAVQILGDDERLSQNVDSAETDTSITTATFFREEAY